MPEHQTRFNLWRAALGGLLLALAGASALAAGLDPAAVIAESHRTRLTVADYEAEVAKLPSSARVEFASNFTLLRQYLDNLYMLRVLAADARAQGLDKDPVLSRQIAMEIDRILARAQVDRIQAAATAEFDRNKDTYVARAKELYEVNPAQYAVPERIRAAHILVKIQNGDRDAALRKAQKIHDEAVAGTDFAKLAKEDSDDALTKDKGGELGFFAAKVMDPAFSAAAFALKNPGDVSEPVLTKFGYHIIRLEDRQPAGVRAFAEVEPELLAQLKKKALDEARAAAQRAIFSDPTLKVNPAIIDQINAEAAAKVGEPAAVPGAAGGAIPAQK
jgi:peptidyl-prolyl cis-trans isomerase C